jgi:hypothetical protein
LKSACDFGGGLLIGGPLVIRAGRDRQLGRIARLSLVALVVHFVELSHPVGIVIDLLAGIVDRTEVKEVRPEKAGMRTPAGLSPAPGAVHRPYATGGHFANIERGAA